MRWEKRVTKNGKVSYSFIGYDPRIGTAVRLKKSEVPLDINTDERAAEFSRLKSLEMSAVRRRIRERLEAQRKFRNFDNLIDVYTKEAKQSAPQSWKNNLYYLQLYVLPFFLKEKQCSNIFDWPLFFEEFKEWLKSVKPLKGQKNQLAFSTMNHCVSALNAFMTALKKHRLITNLEKCNKFPEYLLNKRGVDVGFPSKCTT